jgi:hypothetical protein
MEETFKERGREKREDTTFEKEALEGLNEIINSSKFGDAFPEYLRKQIVAARNELERYLASKIGR